MRSLMYSVLVGVLLLTLCSRQGIAQALQATGSLYPRRIVSLSLASDDILLELLTECGGLQRLAAVSTFADDRSHAFQTERAKQVAARVHSEPEAILTHKPDLVIAASFNRLALLELITKQKIPLLTLSKFSSHLDIAENIRAIGEATGCQNAAKSMSEKFLSRIDQIRMRSSQKKTESALYYSPTLTVMAGDTLFDDLLKMNNLENVASRSGLKYWPTVSGEIVKEWNPRWVVVPCEGDTCSSVVTQVKAKTAWKNLQAVQENRFMFISNRDLTTTSQFFGVELKRSSTP